MPINAGKIVNKGKEQPKKAAPTPVINESIKATNIVIKNNPINPMPAKIIESEKIPEKYRTEADGELVKKINTKSQYMMDVLNLDQN